MTGYEIDTIKESDYSQMMAEEIDEDVELSKIEELSANVVTKLVAAGYETVADLLDADQEALLNIHGIGPKTVEQIVAVIKRLKGEADEE